MKEEQSSPAALVWFAEGAGTPIAEDGGFDLDLVNGPVWSMPGRAIGVPESLASAL